MQSLSWFNKIQASVFQAVTTRTAGFCTIPQESLTDAAAFVSIILMFIGGSPVGTAGGIKTVTVIVLFCTMRSVITGKNDVTLLGRSLPPKAIQKSVAVAAVSFTTVLISTLLLAATQSADFFSILYEAVSAAATVGLSRSVTPTLDLIGKLVIIFTMYFGRVGPISIAIAIHFGTSANNVLKLPEEDVTVG